MLSDREKLILSYIVGEYINNVKPVSSRMLSKFNEIGYSSATIRNVMADLEEKGYIYQPHVSAGRIPTDKGYRFYVDNLMRIQSLTFEEKRKIEAEYRKNIAELDKILQQTSIILSKISKKIGVALSPAIENDIITCLNILPVAGGKLLFVLVTKSGIVKEHLFSTSSVLSRSEIERINNYLNDLYVGKSIEYVLNNLKNTHFSLVSDMLLDNLLHELILAQKSNKNIYVEGIVDFMKEKVADAEDLDIVSPDLIHSIFLDREQNNNSIVIKIGEENKEEALKEYSVISKEIVITDDVRARIAILGEKRVNYGKIVSLLGYTSQIIEKMIKKVVEEE